MTRLLYSFNYLLFQSSFLLIQLQLGYSLDYWSLEITDAKLVSWPAFETLLLTKYQDIDKWIKETTVKFAFIDEETKLSEVITREITDKSLASANTASTSNKSKCKQLLIIIIQINTIQAQSLALWQLKKKWGATLNY